MNNFKSLIENFERLCPLDAKRGHFCQCGTEKMLKRLREPEAMRAFLLVAVFIDQFIYTHYSEVYMQFSGRYRVPKLHAHSAGSMASPSWFIYSNHGYDKDVDWSVVNQIAEIIIRETKRFLTEQREGFQISKFDELLKEEIEVTFGKEHQQMIFTAMN